MPNPTKPTTNLTREELEMQSFNSLESEGIKRRGFMSGTTRKDDELRMEIIRKTSTRMSLSDVDIVMQIVKQYGIQERADEIEMICDEVGLFTKSRNKAVYQVYLKISYLKKRVAELTALKDAGTDTRISNDKQETKQ